MAKPTIEQELQAIKTIAETLEPLDKETRQRALEYAMQHLGITLPKQPIESQATTLTSTAAAASPAHPVQAAIKPITDIRTLKDQKQPSTDIEMATLLAYYLKHLAPDTDRKDEIGTDDIETYFVQAGYPLPTNTAYTLPNAKKAGYLEKGSYGKYKLNSVGHNLVAHNMPRTDNTAGTKPKKKKNASKKSAKKKSAKKKSR
jgi:hypothetical protein